MSFVRTLYAKPWIWSFVAAIGVFITGIGTLSARQAGVQSAIDVANSGQGALKKEDRK